MRIRERFNPRAPCGARPARHQARLFVGGERLGGGKGCGYHGRQRSAATYHAAGSRDDDPESDKITCPNRAQEGAGGESPRASASASLTRA